MPGLARKLTISATSQGLLVQSQKASNLTGARIEYGSNRILPTSKKDESASASLEAHGIVGILDLVKTSYLIAITKREEAARIRNKSIYRVTDVVLIPLKSREEAEKALVAANKILEHDVHLAYSKEEEGDVGDEVEAASVDSVEDGKPGVLEKSTTFVRDVVQDKGRYGRFASKWFSGNGSKESVRRQVGLPAEEGLTREQRKQEEDALPEDAKGQQGSTAGDQKEAEKVHTKQSAIEYLTPRILKSARLYFSSSGFYFSYDHDISAKLAQKEFSSSAPLWRRFDSLYFWNRNMMKPFITAELDAFILPLMQGFVGQQTFTITETEGEERDVVAEASHQSEEAAAEDIERTEVPVSNEESQIKTHDLLLTLISRRSVKRAGLRYLRRGIDDEGSVANNVETEQVLSTQDWSDSDRIFSLVQIRGSMPLFFSQSPYSFKPIPVFLGSEATNQAAFKKHFQGVTKRYGGVQCVSLVDKKPPENVIGKLYEKHAKLLNDDEGLDGANIGFEWFDFHGACKGMKFENVRILMDTLQEQLNAFGWSETQTNKQQKGVVRTNCMDCLDRTNVVQSAIAGWALQQQLQTLNLAIDLKSDPRTQWFNTLWADNGDSCSRQYAGTSALKGDFTRTRKRNWTGALTDFSLTLNRYYNNIFGDYFLQTNIDYFLGNAGPGIFDKFETDMQSEDYALDMSAIRQGAIDTCVKIVLEDEEELQGGWTLSCPAKSNTIKALPFEECVLLLTQQAVYFCRFDWDTEKVASFERVDLWDVRGLERGAYITSALGETHLDEERNVGFVVRYERGIVRRNTRSLSVVDEGEKATKKAEETLRFLAFKALPPNLRDKERMSEKETVKHITDEVQRAMKKVWSGGEFQHIEVDKPPEVEERDLISVAEAKRSTGYMESLGYSLKKLVWS